MRTTLRKARLADRSLVSILVLLTFLAGTGFRCCRWCPAPPPDVEHQLFIRSGGSGCEIVDEGLAPAVTAKRGEWVVWKNEFGRNVKLEFPDARLFGVLTAISYAQGTPLKLRLRDDAEVGRWRYRPLEISTQLPPPEIIIPPPDEP